MRRIAVIINGDLQKNRQGQINSALLRAKYLRYEGGFNIDIICVQEYDSFLLRVVRRSEAPNFFGSFSIDGQLVNVIYKKCTLIDTVFEKIASRRSIGDILGYRKIAKKIKGYDLISGHSIVGGKVAYEVNRKYGIPYSVTWHGSDIHTFPLSGDANKRLINSIIHAASSNIFVSMSLLNTAITIFHDIPYPHVFYNAPGDRFIKYSDSVKTDIRNKYNVSGKKVVAFVGNLVNVKNVFSLPEIFDNVRREYPETIFWIIGDGNNRTALESEMGNKGIACKFWGNRQPEEMPDFMNCIDVLVLPSKNESFGMVLVEAIACGANCVGSKAGGIPEVIGIENSFELDSSFTKNIAVRIVELLSSTIVQTINPEFSWPSTAHQEKMIFNNIINKYDCEEQ